MRTIIFFLLLSPLFSLAQKTDVFIKLTDARSQQIKGESVVKGFEKWIGASTINAGGKNNLTATAFITRINGFLNKSCIQCLTVTNCSILSNIKITCIKQEG